MRNGAKYKPPCGSMSVRPHHDEVGAPALSFLDNHLLRRPREYLRGHAQVRCPVAKQRRCLAHGRIRSLSERDDKASRGAEDKKPEEA